MTPQSRRLRLDALPTLWSKRRDSMALRLARRALTRAAKIAGERRR